MLSILVANNFNFLLQRLRHWRCAQVDPFDRVRACNLAERKTRVNLEVLVAPQDQSLQCKFALWFQLDLLAEV